MSTAFYPTNMRQQSASGYSNNSTLQNIPYVTWKGRGPNSNPVGVTASHIRPLTNNDAGNVFPTGFGLPRPIKHYRKGRVIPQQPVLVNPTDSPAQQFETSLINNNLNRIVRSSTGSSLGGGAGGRGLLNQMLDTPGSYLVKQNPLTELDNINQLENDCKTCEGVGIIASYYPNTTYLTDNPEPNTTNPPLCCNEEKKALRRVIYASTNLKKNYYTTTKQYLQNRCQTYEQKAFNFLKPNPVEKEAIINSGNPFVTEAAIDAAKPGSALATLNTYLANCQPNTCFSNYPRYPDQGPINTIGCKLTVYKPNNPQFAKQGAVSSSTRILKLNVDTIQTNAASFSKKPNNLNSAYNDIGANPNVPFIYKYKTPPCNPATYSGNPFFFQGQFQNKKICSKTTGDEYKNFVSVYQRSAGNYIGATLP